ncbi:hypothetical protein U91I_00342 [alpha proteobacterium U9-1i]|nr:hypothetical protein U91I_00342 [alpha proteobacterium U9-1i]
MKALSVAFALVLAACTPPAAQPTAEAPAASVADATSAKPVDAAPAPAPAATAISADALVGRWGDNGDCTKDIVFAADGTFRSYTGGSGRWSLNGDRVTMAGQGGTFEVRVESVNANQMIVGNPDGSFGISQRC